MITPIGENLYVKVVQRADVSGGILIPDSAARPEEVVEVVAIGADVTVCKVGDRVVCTPGTGVQMPIDGKECVFIQQRNIIAIIGEVKEGEILPA